MAITRAQQARQMLQDGNQVLGPLEEDDLQTSFVSGAKRFLTPGNIGRGLAFILSGGATSAAEIAKEIAKQKVLNEARKKVGEVIGPRIETELMQQQNEMRGTGGYQSDFSQDSGFMGGSGTAAEMGSFADGGRIGFFKGAQADASAGKGAMSPGTDTSGGFRGGNGDDKPTRKSDNEKTPVVVNPIKNLQTHFDNNQKLKDAVALGLITNDEYNVLGGYDAKQTLGMGPIDTGLSSLGYNVVQSIKGDQPFSDIFGDVSRNVKGATNISPELQTKYENIMQMADGGRIGLQEGGGIEQRLEQLGGDVSSAEQLLQGINKRLETAESSLGSGGGGLGGGLTSITQLPAGGTLATLASASQPNTISEERMNALGRSAIGNGFYDLNRGLNNLQPALPGVGPNVGNEIAQPNAPFMGRPILQPLLDQPLGQPLPATLETAQPGPNPFGIINSLTDSRGPAFNTMENAYKNAVDSSAEMKRIGRLDQLDVLGGRLNFEDYKKNFSMNDEGFVTRNPGSTPLGMQSQGTSGVPALGFADGGRIGAAEGGIMDLETGRQMYFLGKLVKKATRAVKKVVKSPIGKAALLYAGTAGLGSLGAGGGLSSLFKLNTFAPATVKANLGTSFARLMGGKLMADPTGLFAEGQLPGKQNIFQKALGLVKDNPFEAITAASAVAGALTAEQEQEAQQLADNTGIDIEEARNQILKAAAGQDDFRARAFKADGGIMRAGYQEGSKEPVAKKTMPLLDMGGKEMDLREDGGFVPIGRMEKADDVPARLSKNEFVFTADAVRNAGDGNVDKGAEVMYNMMKNLESGGDVSEESQGLEGARKMFQTSQRLEEVL